MQSFTALFQFFKKDLTSLRHAFVGRFFDTFLFFFTNAIVFGYFVPQLSSDYGPFLVVGAISSFGLIEVTSKIYIFISDIESNRNIAHALVLPLRSTLYLCYVGFFWAVTSALLTILLFPIGKILLYNQFSIANVSYFHFFLMFITCNLFYGMFGLWVSSLMRNMDSLNSLWARSIGPMWMFGAYFYKWHSVYDFSHIIGYINLINPMVFIMEGMRAAVLGQEGYLPFWICFFVVWFWIIVCTLHGVSRLKKRLDCI